MQTKRFFLEKCRVIHEDRMSLEPVSLLKPNIQRHFWIGFGIIA